ncbi:lysophospholipid acyltransferase family protein [Cognatiyoonia sp. IB215182]|uniref:lysophospholipid acyltransferase family protein n=1 Tax=Cognatiyoonia sp. IB215182 TaxID=3097353 RepID=UPI002A17334F|nr:lysophospholipid acyltransferase family protein [Cognatiyoonia sp. IB215182]MDX8354079.1 lysophospholipid acyltransferase family protein [Cognatiyoonia sp. IB215182]
MTDTTPKVHTPPVGSDQAPRVYDRGSLTYSNTFDSPVKRRIIKTIEWMTGKIHVVRMIRQFEKKGKLHGPAFWRGALDVMGIDLITPAEQIARIPKTGPVVLVANHPHGMVDGMILADLIGRARQDYKILTRAFLTNIDKSAGEYMIPVPFPHDEDAQAKMVEMRKNAMAHLKNDGLIALFPSGVVASSNSMFGPVIEDEWNVFTAKMIRTSGARVVPLFFPGANSRWYQIANQLSPTLRQSLLIHEIVNACGRPQKPVVGHVFDQDEVKDRLSDPRRFMAWLREETLSLKG